MALPSLSRNWGHHTSPYTFPVAVKASGVKALPGSKLKASFMENPPLSIGSNLVNPTVHITLPLHSTSPGEGRGLPPPPEPGIRKALALDPLDLADLCGFSEHPTPSTYTHTPTSLKLNIPRAAQLKAVGDVPPAHIREPGSRFSSRRTLVRSAGAVQLCSCTVVYRLNRPQGLLH